MTAEQMWWAIGKGYAWPAQEEDEGFLYWTARGLWALDVMSGVYVLTA